MAMAVLARFAQGSGQAFRRFGLEIGFSIAALVVVAYGVSRALPSADLSRFDRDNAWVGQLARSTPDSAPETAAAQTSASLTVAPTAIAGTESPVTGASVPKAAKPAVVPPRRPKGEALAEPVAPAAVATPVAATSSDFLGLSRVTNRLPSRETLLKPFDAVGSTVADFFRKL